MNEEAILTTVAIIGAVGITAYWINKNKESLQHAIKDSTSKETTVQDRIDYLRSAKATAYDSQDVSEYLRLQRELDLLELEMS